MRLATLLPLLLTACPHLSEQDLSDRMDLDVDGVPRPEDCDDDDPEIGAAESLFFDSDGDGFGSSTPAESCAAVSSAVANSDDCDDNDATVFPGAEEICDGADTDCNGSVDDVADPPIWYADADDDGYGNGQAATLATCEQPSGYVANGEDCDDLNAGAFPDNKEVCDALEVDEDCSGAADDADPNIDPETQVTVYQDEDGDGFGVEEVTGLACHAGDGWALVAGDCDDTDAARNPDTWWYRDADEDGYGDATFGVRSCHEVEAYVPNALDCNDADPQLNPDAQEVCDPDDIDEDCDGLLDDDDDSVSGQLTIYEDVDGDGYGDDATETLACDLWSGWALAAGDCEVGDAAFSPGEPEDCTDLIDQDCDGDIDCDDVGCSRDEACGYFDIGLADARWHGQESYEQAGEGAIAWAGDVNGDGQDEVLIGSGGASSAHGAFLIDAAASASGNLHKVNLAYLTQETSADSAGCAVAGLGDLNEDGFADFAVGASGFDGAALNAGAVYVVMGPVSGTASLATADTLLVGAGAGHGIGRTLDHGPDASGDGVDDLLVGVSSGSGHDGVYFVDSIDVSSSVSSIEDVGLHLSSIFVHSTFSICGDCSGDGVGEVLLAESSTAGSCFLIPGPITTGGYVSGMASTTFGAVTSSVGFGRAVACGGDQDGDGLGEIAVSADRDSTAAPDAGAVYLFRGPFSSWTTTASAYAVLLGEAEDDQLGTSITMDADLDADGFTDVLVGAVNSDSNGADSGTVYVLYGPVTGTISVGDADARIGGEAAGDGLGDTVAFGGDIDGDDAGDLLLGAPYSDEGGPHVLSGAVYLILGPRL
jgi:hypothetical protein